MEIFLTIATGAMALLIAGICLAVLAFIQRLWYNFLYGALSLDKRGTNVVAVLATILTIVGMYFLGWIILN